MFDLSVYAGKRICVAVSGGRDSMALLNYMYTNKDLYGIELTALNCDHRIRKETSERDSALVESWCFERGVPLLKFVWDYEGVKTEQNAREWRRQCYAFALEKGCDFVACAHHLDDNAETVLFNLARGSAVAGLSGISDGDGIIHPLIACPRTHIDEYVAANGVPYYDDETNFSDGYTRNKIRRHVLPALNQAVPGASGNIYRLSRLAADDEQYFSKIIADNGILKLSDTYAEIKPCDKVVFKRACVRAVKYFNRKDYTCEHLQNLYALINAPKSKKFQFCGLTAYRGEDKIVIADKNAYSDLIIPFGGYTGEIFGNRRLKIADSPEQHALYFDADAVPKTAVIRFRRDGDAFKKYGGGTKSLGDFFTDRKIPLWERGNIPLIADGSEILAVCGVEISDKIKVTSATRRILYITVE